MSDEAGYFAGFRTSRTRGVKEKVYKATSRRFLLDPEFLIITIAYN
jgi:hypothetical protein